MPIGAGLVDLTVGYGDQALGLRRVQVGAMRPVADLILVPVELIHRHPMDRQLSGEAIAEAVAHLELTAGDKGIRLSVTFRDNKVHT